MHHLVRNAAEWFGKKVESYVWQHVSAETQEVCNAAIAVLEKEISPTTTNYVNKIRHNCWARYVFPGARFSCTTSNTVEILNAPYVDSQLMPILEMFDCIWSDQMEKFAKRRMDDGMGGELAASAVTLFSKQNNLSQTYTVQLSNTTSGCVCVVAPPNALTHIIQLNTTLLNGTYTCGFFQEHLLPCRHVVPLCHTVKRAPKHFINLIYHLDTL